MKIILFACLIFVCGLSVAAPAITISEPDDIPPSTVAMENANSTTANSNIPKATVSISQMGKIGRDLNLLEFRQQGLNLKLFQFGGDAELLYTHSDNVSHAFNKASPSADESDIDLVNLRAYFLVSPTNWLFATGTYRFNTSYNFSQATDGAYNQNIDDWQDAFVTIGDLNKLPYYITAGKQYIPFGSFRKLSAYTNPLTKTVFRMNGDAITLGREKNNLNTLFSVYKAKDHHVSFVVQNNYLFNWGKISKANVGVGFSSDMADMTSAIEKSVQVQGNTPLPAIDLYAEWSIGKYSFKSEINQTLADSQNNQKFGAWALEGQYAFQLLKPSAVTLGYSMLYNGDGIFDSALPKEQWVSSYKIQLPFKTYLGFEYVRGTTFIEESYNEFNVDITVKF